MKEKENRTWRQTETNYYCCFRAVVISLFFPYSLDFFPIFNKFKMFWKESVLIIACEQMLVSGVRCL
jgi:hypothetical protein